MTRFGPTNKARVLLVDDHPIVRQGMTLLINDEADLHVCGEAATAAEAVKQIDALHPDVVVVDISLQDRSGLELIKELQGRDAELPILALSMHEESLYAERVLRAGGRGYITKQEAPHKVLDAIRKVLSGQIYVSEQAATRLLNHFASNKTMDADPIRRLSDRELEVFTLIGRGYSTREIAERLYLSVKTVEAHREHIKDKLNIRNWIELLRQAMHFALEHDKPAEGEKVIEVAKK